MHTEFEKISARLRELASQIQAMGEHETPFNLATQHWSALGLSAADLSAEAGELADMINAHAPETIDNPELEERLSNYAEALNFARANTVPQFFSANSGQATSSISLTLSSLRRLLLPLLQNSEAEAEAISKQLKRLKGLVLAMESRMEVLEPRTQQLDTAITHIEQVREAAESFPTDLRELREAQKEITDLRNDAHRDSAYIGTLLEKSDGLSSTLEAKAKAATSIMAQCDSAYAAATSQGLAAAFYERSSKLAQSMWVWVAGLVVALVFGTYFGSSSLESLKELLNSDRAPGSIIALNLLIAAVSVGAPIWFAWLSTKQIGQRFRLAEDYAFKASVSRAYEGYRREARNVGGEEMELELLASALSRLDEQPLRLVEPSSHGSPWHELMASDAVKRAIQTVPNFVDNVTTMAKAAIGESARSLSRQRGAPTQSANDAKSSPPKQAAENE